MAGGNRVRGKQPHSVSVKRVVIKRIVMTDTLQGTCLVFVRDENDPDVCFYAGTFILRLLSQDAPTKIFFDVKDEEDAWAILKGAASTAISEIHLRSSTDIEFSLKK